jgi:two-component system CheB/CheR fusion protein
MTFEADASFEQLLEFLREDRGFDYTAYKRPSLVRRFEKRAQAVRAQDWDAYRAHLERNPDEFRELFDTIPINVTGFFRDRETWEYVASEVIPAIVDQKRERASIRIWSAGCASGEEPFTIAILFAEAMGEDAVRERIKIYATDVDESALAQGRHAAYPPKQVADVPDELRDKYFRSLNGDSVLRNELRRAVIFGRNDLVQDPPISRIDLLVCRNTLMYFGPQAQDRILSNFYFALNRRGLLMLGKAEAIHSRTNLFEPHNLKRRLFGKNAAVEAEARARRATPARAEPLPVVPTVLAFEPPGMPAFEQAAAAQLVVDSEGRLAAVNHAARDLFRLTAADVGRPLKDLEVSYRPLELRSLIEEVQDERRPLMRREVEWPGPAGEQRHYDVEVTPLTRDAGAGAATSVTFTDVTRYRLLHKELEDARQELETAYEELQSTVEELETTNEELQSTNEELETTNEELQSTNEELETINQELQSTNEELETMNDELRERTDEASEANAFLRSILASIQQSVIVVDDEFRVRAWSLAATELWGPREAEVLGEHLFNLDIGLAMAELRGPIKNVLAGVEQADVELVGHDRRGRPIRCSISVDPLRGHGDRIGGVTLVVSTERA